MIVFYPPCCYINIIDSRIFNEVYQAVCDEGILIEEIPGVALKINMDALEMLLYGM